SAAHLPDLQPAAATAAKLTIDVGALTDIGKHRETNEDAYAVCRIGRTVERLLSNLPEPLLAPPCDESGRVVLRAAAMEGVAGGEVASHAALAKTFQLILNAPKWALRLDDPATRETEIAEMWERARGYVSRVHAEIRGWADKCPNLKGMGTTLTGAYTTGSDLFVLHLGDSRAYLFRQAKVCKITHDHTVAQSYVDMGILRESDEQAQRLRHVLTRAIGGPDDTVDADIHALQVGPGDRVLLCTDGLSNLVDEEEMAGVLATDASSQDACRMLVDLALEYGGLDNITAGRAGRRAGRAAAAPTGAATPPPPRSWARRQPPRTP